METTIFYNNFWSYYSLLPLSKAKKKNSLIHSPNTWKSSYILTKWLFDTFTTSNSSNRLLLNINFSSAAAPLMVRGTHAILLYEHLRCFKEVQPQTTSLPDRLVEGNVCSWLFETSIFFIFGFRKRSIGNSCNLFLHAVINVTLKRMRGKAADNIKQKLQKLGETTFSITI